MSDPRTKAERSKAKDIRQGVIEQRESLPKSRKKKIDKPYHVCTTWMNGNKPWVVHRCRSLEHAQQMMAKMMRTHYSARDIWIEINGEKINGVQLLSD